MLQPFITVLDWFGLCVFAVTGALVASRKEMDIVGFALLGSVTGIGGGTIRDVLLGAEPVPLRNSAEIGHRVVVRSSMVTHSGS